MQEISCHFYVQGIRFLNRESLSVFTFNITLKKCGGKMSCLQYEGCEFYTLTTLSRYKSIAGGMPVYRVDLLSGPNTFQLSDNHSDIWVKRLQCSG